MRSIAIFLATIVFALSLSGGPLSGRRAPGFALPDINLNVHDLYDYRGKVVVLDIIKTDCPACNQFQSTLENLRTRFGDKLQILTIVVPPDSDKTVARFIAAHKIKTPILFDCGQATSSYIKATPQNPTVELPHVFLIDASGWIRNDYGYKLGTEKVFERPETLIAEIDTLIKNPSAVQAAPKAAPAAPKSGAAKK